MTPKPSRTPETTGLIPAQSQLVLALPFCCVGSWGTPPARQGLAGMSLLAAGEQHLLPIPCCPSSPRPPPHVGRDGSEGAGASLRVGGRCVIPCHFVTHQQELILLGPQEAPRLLFSSASIFTAARKSTWTSGVSLLCHQRVW